VTAGATGAACGGGRIGGGRKGGGCVGGGVSGGVGNCVCAFTHPLTRPSAAAAIQAIGFMVMAPQLRLVRAAP
jgi:hypothetical protein